MHQTIAKNIVENLKKCLKNERFKKKIIYFFQTLLYRFNTHRVLNAHSSCHIIFIHYTEFILILLRCYTIAALFVR